MKNENTFHVPQRHWNGANFVRGFRNLMVPITTATEGQLRDWKPEEVWGPYWASLRDFCEIDEKCQELISIIMAKAVQPRLTTPEHRELVEGWVTRHIPGYRLVWESQLVHELNEALRETNETVTAFSFGKDGRGALPDRYYHILAERKLLPIGNHHDILGHLLLFADPTIRRITERIIAVSADGHTLWNYLESYRDQHLAAGSEGRRNYERSVITMMRPAMALLTTSWNLAQEKLYFSEKKGTKTRFALMGAFNTVYNTTFSARLPREHADSTVGGLGIFSADPRRSIVMLPRDMRRWLFHAEASHASPEMKELRATLAASINRYGEVLEAVGWKKDPDHDEVTEHGRRFHQIVVDSLFAQIGPFRLPMRTRWTRLGRKIQGDPLFGLLLQRKAMLPLAEAQIEIAAAALAYHARYFSERARVSPPRPVPMSSPPLGESRAKIAG